MIILVSFLGQSCRGNNNKSLTVRKLVRKIHIFVLSITGKIKQFSVYFFVVPFLLLFQCLVIVSSHICCEPDCYKRNQHHIPVIMCKGFIGGNFLILERISKKFFFLDQHDDEQITDLSLVTLFLFQWLSTQTNGFTVHIYILVR